MQERQEITVVMDLVPPRDKESKEIPVLEWKEGRRLHK